MKHLKLYEEYDNKIIKLKTFETEEGVFSVYDIDDSHRNRNDYYTVFEHPDGWIVRNVILPIELQNQNISTNFYIYINDESIKNTGNPLRSTQERVLNNGESVHELSILGIKLWDSLVRKGYAKKISLKNYIFIK